MIPKPLSAALEISDFLTKHEITHVLIGGLAAQIHGGTRLTVDTDFTIAASLDEGSEPLVRLITGQFSSRTNNPIELAQKSRMILVTASNGVDVDISLALPGYEFEMFARSIEFEVELGEKLQVCSPEDLIIHKAVAGRPQDIFDIQGVIYRQGNKLDLEYIRDWLWQFSDILGNPSVMSNFESAWEKFINPDSI